MTIQAFAAHKANGKLEPFEYELGSLKPDEVEVDIEYCGICHSDLHMLKNEWGFTQFQQFVHSVIMDKHKPQEEDYRKLLEHFNYDLCPRLYMLIGLNRTMIV